MSSRRSGKRSRFRIGETWRSWTSWMHWRRRRILRERERQDRMLQALEEMLQRHHRELERQVAILLLESLRPLAAALKRQDELLLDRTEPLRQVLAMQHEQVEMLQEVLSSLQPPAETQIFEVLEHSTPQPSPLSSDFLLQRLKTD